MVQEKRLYLFLAKSAVVTFKKNSRMPQASELRIAGDVIPRLDSFQFLGIVFYPRLSMVKRIEHRQQKCSKRLNLFQCIVVTE